jgi:polar amino acid transport system substrate-binding protein
MRRRLVVGFLAAAVLVSVAEVFAEPEALRVGTAVDYAPLAFEERGEFRGAELDFARRLARDLGREPQIVKIPWAELIPALREKRVDILMSGISITPERAELVQFCDPYLEVGQMALIRTAEWAERSPPGAIGSASSRVGFVVRTTGERFARAKLAGAKLEPMASIDEGVAALRAGKIDYFVHDAPTIWRVVGGFASDESQLTGLYTPLTDEQLAWAVRREDTELLRRINAALGTWKREGFVDEVLDRWIPVRKISRPRAQPE